MISFKYFGTHYLTDEMKQALAGGTQTVTMPFGQSSMLHVAFTPYLDTRLIVV